MATLGSAILPAWSQASPSPSTLEVPATTEVRLAAPGAEHVEALNPSIVDAQLVAPDVVSIRGVRPGTTTVLIVTASDLVTWQVNVTRPPAVATGPMSAQGGWLDLSYLPTVLPGASTLPGVCDTPPGILTSAFAACSAFDSQTSGIWGLSFQANEWTGGAGPGGWRLNVLAHDVTVNSASYLPTPLDQFSGATSWGVSAQTKSGQQVITSPLGAQIYQHVRVSSADLFAGITPLGPLAGAQMTSGSLSATATTLDTAGQLEAAATLSLRMGDLTLSSSDGPAGTGVVASLSHPPFTFNLGTGSSGPQAAVSYDFGSGRTLQAWWSNQNSFMVVLVSPIDFGATQAPATPGATPIAGVTQATAMPGATQVAATITVGGSPEPAIVPVGPGSLSLTPPPPGSSVPFSDLRLPLPTAPAQPPQQPGGPGQPTAVILLRACLHIGTDAACGPSDSPLTITMLVDGAPTLSSPGLAIPVVPGQHRIEIPLEDVPALMIPLGGLSCDVNVAAFSTATCDFPFRRAGSAP